jgi:hypothetical protein
MCPNLLVHAARLRVLRLVSGDVPHDEPMPATRRWFLALFTVLLVSGCDTDRTRPESLSRVAVHDGRNDLWVDFAGTRAPLLPDGDAVGAVVRRTSDALVVTVRYVDIEPRANTEWGVDFRIDIPGDRLHRQVSWSESQYADTHRWNREADYVEYDSEDPLGERCDGLHGKPDFTAETVTVRVPDRCFSRAPQVVVSGLSARSRSRGGDHLVDYVGTDGSEPPQTPRLGTP